ncbi:short-chain dehydrogenase TIC 32, chloroplastic-like [Papaver somniferum]|uniref:short-chain dehydrogenase TIC 32, chloroplastic-like n=1 Tax=Papaver somniferum TaxID=3469 RepID=UPI000E700990|nr:short-chain dehydrogenase TIC 32, chloroplastic-like [Papaver somniferum]
MIEFSSNFIPGSRKKRRSMWRLLSRFRGPSGYSASNTAEEVTHGIDATGLTAVITGASSGIGAETARVLSLRGVHVVMAVRNMTAGRAVKDAIVKENPNAKVDVMELDLSSIAAVRKFAAEFKSKDLPLNILINNAGVAISFTLSEDKIELTFATNHLGHFLLTELLLETMKITARKSNIEGRVVNVSSALHWIAEKIRFDKINEDTGSYVFQLYAQSKLANILHANELARRLKEEGVQITANSLHPGVITTGIYQHCYLRVVFNSFLGKFLKNVQQGASTTCYIALHPNLKGITGKYFVDNNFSKQSRNAKDTEEAKKLWDFSMNLVRNK